VYNKNSYRVLLIDDNIDQGNIIKKLFEQSETKDITVKWFIKGESVLSFLKSKQSPQIDLILLETELTGFSGRDIVKYLKSDSSPYLTVPLIIFTNSEDQEHINQLFSWGLNSWIMKPIEPSVFKETVELIKEFWLDHALLPSSFIS
jgi:DNA-binding response OmpR family regulator